MPIRPCSSSEDDATARRAAGLLPAGSTEASSTTPLGQMIGDDLPRARRFCDKARVEMDAILYAERNTASDLGRDPHWLCERLTLIQHGAKLARARAVYRSAQEAMRLIHCHGPHMPIDWSQVDGRLITLNKLLSQYHDGLVEVESEIAFNPAPETRAKRQPERPEPSLEACNDTKAYVQAKETLSALLPLTGLREREALQQLITVPTTVEMFTTPDPELSLELEQTPSVSLETEMPDLVQRLLGHGRVYGKTLSVSYALEAVRVCEGSRAQILDALWNGLEPRIAADMPLQGVGHIDIVPEGSVLQVSGSGFAPFTVSLGDNDGQSAHAGPIPAPRITPDTEDDLRAQLSALLTGGALQS